MTGDETPSDDDADGKKDGATDVNVENARAWIAAALARLGPLLVHVAAAALDSARSGGAWLRPRLKAAAQRTAAANWWAIGVTLGFVAAVVGALYLLVQSVGVVSTVAYVVLFGIGGAIIPGVVVLFAPSFPRFLRSMMGRLHWLLGQQAYGVGWLVQLDDRWTLCPGTRNRLYLEGRWYDVPEGQTNLNVLGWQAFGIVRFKTRESLSTVRSDPDGATTAAPDGSGAARERGDIAQLPPDPEVSGIENTWLVNLIRVYATGVDRIGDIDVVERAERLQLRRDAQQSRLEGYETIIASVIGLVLGVGTGYLMLGGG